MRTGLLAALTVLLASHGLTFAQPDGSYPAGSPLPPEGVAGRPAATAAPMPAPAMSSLPNLTNLDPASCEPCGDVDAQARPFGFRGSGEYLLWWFKNGAVPPLATAGGNGGPGATGTQVLVDNLSFDEDLRQGGRFALGYYFETIPFLGIEANHFFLADGQSDFRFASSGAPVLGRPFLNVVTGLPDATLIASPGIAAGSVTIGTRTWLWGTEANLAATLIGSDTLHLAALGGFRFLRLEDEVTIGEHFRVAPDVPGFGGNTVGLQDAFRTVNRFYGGQVGLETGVRLGLLTIDFRGKIALGQMHQVAYVNGATGVLRPDGSTTLLPGGGLLALRSNSGRHQRDELTFIPEVGLTVGWQLTRQVKLSAGYSLLWVSTVARAGEQIDPVVNVTQFPILSGAGPLMGAARPAFHFDGTDFWAQGLNFGLELRY
jgi:hypothetical protein